MTSFDHIIIGNGIAGVSAVEEIRKRQPDASIGIVSEENEPCYSRVLLPHYVKGKIPREKVFVKSRDWYARAGLSVFWGRHAARLDPGNHEVTLDDGATLRYGRLLIATGGRVRGLSIAGGDHPAVLPFRTLEDADRIRATLDRVAALPAAEQDVAILGGGFIGLEFPSIFRGRGFRTRFFVRGPYYWSGTWDAASAAILESTLTSNGVEMYKGMDITEVVGDNFGLLRNVRAGGRDFPARAIGFGIGLLPNLEAARSAGLPVGSGIGTNEYLETAAPDVLAAGDVAEFLDVTVGKRHRLGNWLNAVEQGRHAGANMCGERRPFVLVSQYTTTVFGCVIAFVGDVAMDTGIEVIARGAGTNQYGRLLLKDGKLRGATLLNRISDRAPLAELIRSGRDVTAVRTNLADPSFDLKHLLS